MRNEEEENKGSLALWTDMNSEVNDGIRETNELTMSILFANE